VLLHKLQQQVDAAGGLFGVGEGQIDQQCGYNSVKEVVDGNLCAGDKGGDGDVTVSACMDQHAELGFEG
jgi:hypothetical protein